LATLSPEIGKRICDDIFITQIFTARRIPDAGFGEKATMPDFAPYGR